MAGLLSLTAVATVLFWSLFPIGGGGGPASEAAFEGWRRSFPLAEAWMALTAIAAAIGLLWMKDWGSLFGCLAGSALVFLGLAGALFFLQHNLYASLVPITAVEMVVHAWCLLFGPFVIAYLWGKRRWFFFET